jgi:hypothetical protein
VSVEESAVGLRCPFCSARLKSGAEWCSLCLADLRPPPSLPPASPQAPPPPEPPPRGGRHAKRDDVSPGDGATAAVERLSGPDRESVEAMFALLAAEQSDGLGTWSKKFSTPGAKVALMAGGGATVMVVLLLVFLVVGALLPG